MVDNTPNKKKTNKKKKLRSKLQPIVKDVMYDLISEEDFDKSFKQGRALDTIDSTLKKLCKELECNLTITKSRRALEGHETFDQGKMLDETYRRLVRLIKKDDFLLTASRACLASVQKHISKPLPTGQCYDGQYITLEKDPRLEKLYKKFCNKYEDESDILKLLHTHVTDEEYNNLRDHSLDKTIKTILKILSDAMAVENSAHDADMAGIMPYSGSISHSISVMITQTVQRREFFDELSYVFLNACDLSQLKTLGGALDPGHSDVEKTSHQHVSADRTSMPEARVGAIEQGKLRHLVSFCKRRMRVGVEFMKSLIRQAVTRLFNSHLWYYLKQACDYVKLHCPWWPST